MVPYWLCQITLGQPRLTKPTRGVSLLDISALPVAMTSRAQIIHQPKVVVD